MKQFEQKDMGKEKIKVALESALAALESPNPHFRNISFFLSEAGLTDLATEAFGVLLNNDLEASVTASTDPKAFPYSRDHMAHQSYSVITYSNEMPLTAEQREMVRDMGKIRASDLESRGRVWLAANTLESTGNTEEADALKQKYPKEIEEGPFAQTKDKEDPDLEDFRRTVMEIQAKYKDHAFLSEEEKNNIIRNLKDKVQEKIAELNV